MRINTNNQLFIEQITKSNADYNNPEQAITTANLCDTISRDINTDSQRFIYELLQNADDASNQYGELDVCINFSGNYFIFSHNGLAFSEVDIESISSAGDGTKTTDSAKTGFKGIGFKSVFSHSKLVYIQTGNYCFRFDRAYWKDHWNPKWGNKEEWARLRREKNKDVVLKMPWQIIPLASELPNSIQSLDSINSYNVSTIIAYDNIEDLKVKINELFSESQIILFLRSKKVKITINGEAKLILEKTVHNERTTLSRNGVVLSDWLIKTEVFEIGSEIKIAIHADDKSPKKLKEATHTELSFAIQLKDGLLSKVDKQSRLIFTYLPTSVNYNLPFLVNGSFLTDAGRQQLHQDIVWNNWLFEEIPFRYMKWISELADNNSEYKNEILTVIPSRLSINQLGSSFNKGFNRALEDIAFLPNVEGKLLKIRDAIYDRSNITSIVDKEILILHLNDIKNENFQYDALLRSLNHIHLLINLGVYTFDFDKLKDFISSSYFKEKFSIESNFDLIVFLYNEYEKLEEDYERVQLENILKDLPFIYDTAETLRSPNDLYFPASEYADEFSTSLNIIHPYVFKKIDESYSIEKWLKNSINIKEPSSTVFIDRTVLGYRSNYVTVENAIQIGKYIFKAHKNGDLSNSLYDKLKELQILTSKGSLITARDAYLSDVYGPNLKLQSFYDNDFYVSELYIEREEDKREWGTFLLKIGVKDDIGVINEDIHFSNNLESIRKRVDADFLLTLKENSERVYNNSGSGWSYDNGQYRFFAISVYIKTLSYVSLAVDYSFSKILFQRVFQKLSPLDLDPNKELTVYGAFGIINRSVGSETLKKLGCPCNYFEWMINTLSIFPTIIGECRKASEVILNTEENVIIANEFLPVLDYDGVLSPEWKELLNLREYLTLDDYLNVLSQLSTKYSYGNDVDSNDKKRIVLIYEKLSHLELHESEINKITEWGKSNRLLSKNGKDFLFPSELNFVTVNGFNAQNIIYTDKLNSSLIALFKNIGVNVIDSIIPEISNSKIEITSLKTKLKHVSPLIALLSLDKSKSLKSWEEEYNRINNKLDDIHFYQTTDIYLSYGNEDDKQKKSSWADGDCFYYVGDCFSPRILDGLVEPLGSFLNIRYAERTLNVLILDTFENGKDFLIEKGLDISLIPNNYLAPTEVAQGYSGDQVRPYNEIDEDLGKKGELAVFDYLKKYYQSRYNDVLIDTSRGFKIGNYIEVVWQNKDSLTNANHDFLILENGQEIYIDSKATPFGKNREKLALYISGNELALMEHAEKYLIARVYNVTTAPVIEFVKLDLDTSLCL